MPPFTLLARGLQLCGNLFCYILHCAKLSNTNIFWQRGISAHPLPFIIRRGWERRQICSIKEIQNFSVMIFSLSCCRSNSSWSYKTVLDILISIKPLETLSWTRDNYLQLTARKASKGGRWEWRVTMVAWQLWHCFRTMYSRTQCNQQGPLQQHAYILF